MALFRRFPSLTLCVGAGALIAAGCASQPTGSGGETLAFCAPCTADNQCAIGAYCIPSAGAAQGSGFCGQACTTTADCPSDTACQAVSENGSVVGHSCVPVVGSCANPPGNDAGPNNGNPGGNTGGYCSTCSSDSDCPTGGFCLATRASSQAYCGEPCSADQECPSGSQCYSIGDSNGTMVGSNCFPTNGDCSSVDTGDAGNGNGNGDAGNGNGNGDAGPGGSIPTVTLGGCGIVGYTVPVAIGSQNFSLSLDTGSSTTAVAGSTCSSCSGVSPKFTPGNTTQNENKTAQETYGDGSSWSGSAMSDLIQLHPAMPAARTVFAEITQQNGFFRNTDCSGNSVSTNPTQGILGMGPPDLAVQNTQDFFTEYIDASSLPDTFTVQLCPAGTGHMWVGGYDSNYMSGAPQYTPIPRGSGYWEVTVNSMAFSGSSAISGSSNLDSILDTGTTVNLVPSSVYNAILSKLQSSSAFSSIFGSNGYSYIFSQGGCVPASGGKTLSQVNAALPSMTFTLSSSSGGTFTLDVPATGAYLSVISSGGTDYYCSGIENASSLGLGGNGPDELLGDVFLSSFVTVFDVGNGRIGFAPESQCN